MYILPQLKKKINVTEKTAEKRQHIFLGLLSLKVLPGWELGSVTHTAISGSVALSWLKQNRVLGRRSCVPMTGSESRGGRGGRAGRAQPCPSQAPDTGPPGTEFFLLSANPGEESQWPQLIISCVLIKKGHWKSSWLSFSLPF